MLPGPFVMGAAAVPGAYAPVGGPGPRPYDPAGAHTTPVAAGGKGRGKGRPAPR
ncbi:hypothetical protein GCM10010260_10260 [Streptomyces filipinensis]|uniref:Uncharacterized protein n=1 Tax=Streptomyces filipinensis TaxID=66887 RepID=A0A918I625_9ACTN|nr:hypothetical protein GCM10010260_10260 [Streptomyces filipinensis]